MNYAHISIHTDHALGNVDRASRAAISAAVLITIMTVGALGPGWVFGLTLIGIYTGLTALIGEDPFYGFRDHHPQSHGAGGPSAPVREPPSAEADSGRRAESVYKDAA